jgi:hypothetical protein
VDLVGWRSTRSAGGSVKTAFYIPFGLSAVFFLFLFRLIFLCFSCDDDELRERIVGDSGGKIKRKEEEEDQWPFLVGVGV